jgi:hypothetical protein
MTHRRQNTTSDKPTMNQSERTRLTVMQSLKAHKLTQQEAAVRLGLGVNQASQTI